MYEPHHRRSVCGVKITVIGAGSIGLRHIGNLLVLGVPALNITVSDRSAAATLAAAQQFPGISVVEPCDQPIIPHSDAVLICAPAVTHAGYVRAVIARGVPFFLEKPATLSRHELTESEWNTSVPHLVACNMRFTDAWRRLTRQIASRDVWLRLRCLSPMAEWPGQTYGPPVFEFCHEFDLALHAFGAATIDSVDTFEDGVSVYLRHARAVSHVTLGWRHPRVRAWRWVSRDRMDEPEWREHTPVTEDIDESYRLELAHFLSVVSGDQRSVNQLSHAKSVVDLCEAVARG